MGILIACRKLSFTAVTTGTDVGHASSIAPGTFADFHHPHTVEQEFPYWTTDLPYFAAMDAPGVSKRDFIQMNLNALPD